MRARAGVRGFFGFRLLCVGAAALALAAAWPRPAAAVEEILRDTEIEKDIKSMAAPIWRVAGLDPNGVGIYLVEDKALNSFVAGGQAIFLNTGIIDRSENPNMLIGVIAHETGHIAGGHILRSLEAMKNASVETIIAMAAAIGASIAGGGSGAPMIAAAGMGQRAYMSFSVSQEATADHAAMTYLDRTGQSARGLLHFFEILQAGEPLTGEPTDPWARTHPLTSARIDYIRHHVDESRYSAVPDTPENIALLKTVKMKLRAFADPTATLRAYPESDQSPDARYARAIAYYRIPKLDKALPAIDALIRDFPQNPYYRELKGQMLFENGRIRDAIAPYEEAVKLAPQAALLRISLAQVYIESNDPSLNKKAIAYLNDAAQAEGREGTVWRLLAVAYGRDNQLGLAALSLAEQALADGKKKEARAQAQRAKQNLPRASANYARAEEIQREAKEDD